MHTGRMKCVAFVVATVLTASLSSTASAAFVTFDFEELATVARPSIVSTQGGITATIKRLDGGSVRITYLSDGPTVFGSRILSNFTSPFENPGATLIINFSQALSNASISFGDYNQDDDSPVTLSAYSAQDGLGTLLDRSSVDYSAALNILRNNAAVRTLTVNGTGIQSLTLTSEGIGPGSLYYDNLVVSPAPPAAVPEPSSIVLLGIGGLGMHAVHRWSRRESPTVAS